LSTTVDNRIVQMNFENKQFQTGIQESSIALSKFNSQLEGLGGSGSSMSQLGNSVDFVANRFSWFGDLAFQAMEKLNHKIIEIATGLVDAFVVEPPSAGFQEYEMTIDAIQTMMNSTGESLEVVNKELDRLNEYADKTIYSFADMKTNISKFTNAGLKMHDATVVLEGISNLVALAGGNAQSASMSFYNLGQAFSKGKMTAIDWRSLELAGVNTREFTQYVLEAGVAAGTLKKNAQGLYQTLTTNAKGQTSGWFGIEEFRDNLQYGFMNAKVMKDVFTDLADTETEIGKKAYDAATSVRTFSKLMDSMKEAAGTGWAQTFQIVIGNFEEAKKMWTDVNTVVTGMLDQSNKARNEMLTEWKKMGGRDAAIQGIADAFKSLSGILGAVKAGFRDIFPPMTGKTLANITKNFAALMKTLVPAPETLKKVQRIFRGLSAAIDILLTPIKVLWAAFKGLMSAFSSTSKSGGAIGYFLELAAKVGDYVTALDKAIKSSKIFETVTAMMQKVVGKVKDAFAALSKFLETNPLVQGFIKGFTNGITAVVAAVKKFVNKIVETVRKLLGIHSPSTVFYEVGSNCAQGLVNGLIAAGQFIKGAIVTLVNYMRAGFEGAGSKMKNVFSTMASYVSSGWTTALETVRTSLESFSNSLNNIKLAGVDYLHAKFGTLSEVMEKISNAFNLFIEKMTPVYNWIKTKLGVMTDYIISAFQSFNINKFITGGMFIMVATSLSNMVKNFQLIFKPLDELSGTFNKFMDSIGETLEGFGKRVKASAIKTIAIAVAILVGSLILLTFIDPLKLAIGLGAISTLMGELVLGLRGLTTGLGTMLGGTGKIIALAIALFMMTASVAKLAQLDWKAVLAAGVALAGLGFGLKLLVGALGNQMGTTAMQLIALGLAIRLMAGGLASIASNPTDQIAMGMLALVTVIALLALIMIKIPATRLFLMGDALNAMGKGILFLSAGIALLGKLKPETLGKGLLGFAGAMIIIILALAAMEYLKIDKMFPSLLGLAGALLLMVLPIYLLGKMKYESLNQGLEAFAKILLAITILSAVMSRRGKGLAALGGALILMAFAVKQVAGIPWDQLMAGVGTMTRLAVILTVMSLVLSRWMGPENPATGMLSLAAAMFVLALAVKMLSAIDPNALLNGILALVAMLAAVVVALIFLQLAIKPGELAKLGLSIMLLAVALTLMAIPMIALGLIPWPILLQGFIVLAAMLAGLTYALIKMPKGEEISVIAASLLKLSLALAVMAGIMIVLGLMDWKVLVKGFLALALGILVVTVALLALDKWSHQLPAVAKSLLITAAAILVLSGALIAAGFMDKEAWTGLIILGTALVALGLAAFVFKKFNLAPTMLQMGVAIAAMGIALTLLVLPLKMLTDMTWDQLFIGAAGLAALMAIVIIAGYFLQPVSVGVVLFGAAIALMGIGVYFAAAALEKLVDVIARVVNAVKQSWVGKLFGWNVKDEGEKFGKDAGDGVAKGVERTIPTVRGNGEKVATAVTEPVQKALEPKAMQQMGKDGIMGLVTGAGGSDVTKLLEQTGLDAGSALPEGLTKALKSGDVTTLGSQFGLDFKMGMDATMPSMEDIEKMWDPAKSQEENMKNLQKMMPQMQETGKQVTEALNGGPIDAKAQAEKDAKVKAQAEHETQVKIEAKKKETEAVKTETKKQGEEVLKTMAESPKPAEAAAVGEKATGKEEGLGKGVSNGMDQTKEVVTEKMGEVVEVIKTETSPEKTEPLGASLAEGLKTGFLKKIDEVKTSITESCSGITDNIKKVFGINSPSKVFAEIGGQLDEGLANGVRDNMNIVVDETAFVGDKATTSMQSALSNLNLKDLDIDTNPTITPVLDLDSVKADAAGISAIFDKSIGKASLNVGKVSGTISPSVSKSVAQPVSATGTNASNGTTINNNFNVRNESDARTISNRLGTLVSRSQYQRGKVVAVS